MKTPHGSVEQRSIWSMLNCYIFSEYGLQIQSIENFESIFNKYFDLFLEEYPQGTKHYMARLEAEKNGSKISQSVVPLLHGNHPIFIKAIECQTVAASLGSVILNRMNVLGLNRLVHQIINTFKFDQYLNGCSLPVD